MRAVRQACGKTFDEVEEFLNSKTFPVVRLAIFRMRMFFDHKINHEIQIICILYSDMFYIVLGDLGNQGLPGVKKGSSKPSGAHLKHAQAGARYPAHVARARYESILAGWIPPEYRVPRQ